MHLTAGGDFEPLPSQVVAMQGVCTLAENTIGTAGKSSGQVMFPQPKCSRTRGSACNAYRPKIQTLLHDASGCLKDIIKRL